MSEDLIAIAALSASILVVLGYVLLRVWRKASQARAVRLSENWPATDAQVHSSFEFEEAGSEYGSSWILGLNYIYRVDGQDYSGKYFLPERFSEPEAEQEAITKWVGKKIVVRYDQNHPQHSIFLPVDGAPGLSRIPDGLATEPQIQALTLK